MSSFFATEYYPQTQRGERTLVNVKDLDASSVIPALEGRSGKKVRNAPFSSYHPTRTTGLQRSRNAKSTLKHWQKRSRIESKARASEYTASNVYSTSHPPSPPTPDFDQYKSSNDPDELFLPDAFSVDTRNDTGNVGRSALQTATTYTAPAAALTGRDERVLPSSRKTEDTASQYDWEGRHTKASISMRSTVGTSFDFTHHDERSLTVPDVACTSQRLLESKGQEEFTRHEAYDPTHDDSYGPLYFRSRYRRTNAFDSDQEDYDGYSETICTTASEEREWPASSHWETGETSPNVPAKLPFGKSLLPSCYTAPAASNRMVSSVTSATEEFWPSEQEDELILSTTYTVGSEAVWQDGPARMASWYIRRSKNGPQSVAASLDWDHSDDSF